jgi:trigger factor
MAVQVETLEKLERRITLTLAAQTINGEVETRLKKLSRTVKADGFRPGKVPMSVVAQRYGYSVQYEVMNDRVGQAFNDATNEAKLRVAGAPKITQKDEAPEGQMAFDATFEVYPEVKLGDLSVVVVERPLTEVGADDIHHTIDMLRRQRTRYEHVARAASVGDRAIVDFSGKIDGIPFSGGQASDFAIILGEGRMLPEFEAAVSAMIEGETKTFAVTFPADYHGKDVAGKQAEFALTVKSVAAPIVPEVDADFAKAFGIASGSVDDLRAEIASNLRLELKRKIDAKVKEQVFAVLREKAEFALPRSLVELETHNMMQRMENELRQKGTKAEDIKLSPEMFRAGAEARVALGLVLSEVVRAHGLKAKPEQVKALVQEAAQTYEQPEAVVRWHYEKPERLNDFEALAVEHNVVEWVLGKAQVNDVPTTFEALMSPPKA